MGILAEPAAFVRKLGLPKGFAVCELGDQWITHGRSRPAAEFYRELGCGRYDAIDANGKGTITFDLNRKWKGAVGQYDLVTDFGTGEHIFNQAEVWRTVHLLTKPSGFIVFDRPATGYPAHGFYLTDRCLFEDLALANRYRTLRLDVFHGNRGDLIRGVFQKTSDEAFVAPQQGRYRATLRLRRAG